MFYLIKYFTLSYDFFLLNIIHLLSMFSIIVHVHFYKKLKKNYHLSYENANSIKKI